MGVMGIKPYLTGFMIVPIQAGPGTHHGGWSGGGEVKTLFNRIYDCVIWAVLGNHYEGRGGVGWG